MFRLVILGSTILPISVDDVDLIKSQAKQGEAKAQSVLISTHSVGINSISQDYAKAYHWCKNQIIKAQYK